MDISSVLVKRSEVLDIGYVYVPYVISTDCAIINSSSNTNSIRRRNIINKVFRLGNNEIEDVFQPIITLSNRYSSVVNNIYINGVIKNI